MSGESLSFPIYAPDHASKNIREVGDAAAKTAAKLDIAAASAKLWNDTTIKQGKAADTAIASMKTHEKALALVADAENVLAGKATTATKLLADQGRVFKDTGRNLDDVAKAAVDAAGNNGLGALIGSGGATGGGMAALVGLGAVLSPVIATLGVGLGGLGLAALAAGKHSKELAAEIAPLKADFAAFQDQLQPVVLQDFAKAAVVAQSVLHSIGPVAAATGKALGSALGQIGATFQSGEWQQFFGFMARTAGPDIQLLTDNFVGLLRVLPPLLESLQSTATLLLKDTAGILNLVSAVEKAVAVQHQFTQEANNSTGWLGRFAHAAGQAFQQLVPGGVGIKHVADEFGRLASNTGDAAHRQAVITATFGHSGDAAVIAASKVQSLADAVQHLNTQLNNSIKPNSTFIQDEINVRDSAKNAADALQKTHDKIGLNTQAQRNAFGYQKTYIDNLVQLTQDAGHSSQKQDEATAAIKRALPQLQNVKGGTREYWQEVRTLIDWLERERRERNIHKVVSISGAATWSLSNPGGKLAGPMAAGGLIGVGTTSTADDVIARVSKGELIVPARMVQAGAVDHLRGQLPGFAAGGIIPSYSGNVAGLVPWGQHNVNATNAWLINQMARAVAGAVSSAMSSSVGFGTAGPGGGAPAANAALARRMMPAWGSGAEWAAWNAVAMRESGWNQFARNPSSGAYGIPQALPPGKMGPAANPPQSNPAAQISWMIGYIRSRYGDPIGAWRHELSAGWYDQGGYLPTGLSLAYNGTGRPEPVGGGNHYHITVNVPPSANKADVGRQVVEVIREYERRSGPGWRK